MIGSVETTHPNRQQKSVAVASRRRHCLMHVKDSAFVASTAFCMRGAQRKELRSSHSIGLLSLCSQSLENFGMVVYSPEHQHVIHFDCLRRDFGGLESDAHHDALYCSIAAQFLEEAVSLYLLSTSRPMCMIHLARRKPHTGWFHYTWLCDFCIDRRHE